MLKSLILSAAAAGVAAGLVTALIQHVTTTPIILEAEQYEGGGAPAHDHGAAAAAAERGAEHVPAGGDATAVEAHDRGGDEWAPADGIERTLYTLLATTVLGIGFSLALLGAMVLSGLRIDAWSGLAFGAAGFAAVALAPALGLPPEIPGSGAAAIEDRQLWWFFASAAAAAGLAALLLARNAWLKLGGVVLIALPHIFGAPQPPAFESTAPAELAGHFAAASLAVTAIFWALLGAASGAIYERLARAA
jgi:cobalt transporter subunit CbtA